MAAQLAAYLADCQRRVDAQLASCLPENPHNPLYQAMRYSLFNGGKRIRPALCYGAAELFGPATAATHRAAAAVEMIHAYSLIHDDLPAMDNDDLRRGKPTCHIAFDEATAILAGDGLQALAFETLADQGEGHGDAPLTLRMVRELASAAGPGGMVGGQAMDLAAVNRALDLPALEAMHNAKTGALITASVQLGALSSGAATAGDLDALRRFSAAIGLAFQVKDDILDVESHTDTLGKRQGADLALNKPTYTSLLGLDGAKAKLAELHRAAGEALLPFGPRAACLAALAGFIVSRDH
ncbi:MAG: farnesyl diphosphate synthase [Porticoccaceae bacterium]|jgi:geranylgeranyl diphosphate synthase type II|nr:polyprenyl synthetase family protein [Porticoccaceae bacterium]MEA3299480.1 farnesyl diphosphate synthase [Pseudomonadota bacterium]HLS99787.1 farnesyl diphosphate synthase [Porticoccaceae bacterium]